MYNVFLLKLFNIFLLCDGGREHRHACHSKYTEVREQISKLVFSFYCGFKSRSSGLHGKHFYPLSNFTSLKVGSLHCKLG